MLHEPNASSPLPPHTVQFASASEGTSAIAFARLSPQQVFAREGLEQLNRRSNIKGAVQAIAHLSLLGASGYCWMTHTDQLWIGLPALVLYGFAVAATFMPLHECVHRTAFANRRANDLIAWLAGVLSFYNSTFYRRYHQWHHRYTRIPNKDPELTDLIPSNWREYVLHVSGIPWWMGKLQTHFLCATGQMTGFSYIPETARREVQRSMQLQLMVYGCAIAACVYFGQTWFVLGWLLPLAVGQPLLRLILLAEHTGCSLDGNLLTNTRTTLTWVPLRLLLWNMPFHAEHHFCPSIPFHSLGDAHQVLKEHLTHVEEGYVAVNRAIVGNFNNNRPRSSSLS